MKNQKNVVTVRTTKDNLKRAMPIAVGTGAMVAMASANAADFTLDTSTVITAIGVIVAAVTAVALASLGIPLIVKGVRAIKGAF